MSSLNVISFRIKKPSSFSLPLRCMLQLLEPSWLPSSGYSSASEYLLDIWEPKLDTVFPMWPHKRQVEDNNNFPSPAGWTLVNVAWYVLSLHFLKGAGLTLIQLFHWGPQVPFCRAAASLVSPQPIPLHGVGFFVLSARLCPVSPFSSLFKVSSYSNPVLQHISHSPSFTSCTWWRAIPTHHLDHWMC